MHSRRPRALASRARPSGMCSMRTQRPLTTRGFKEHRLNACGYSLGALYPPTWMDYPMLFTGNPVVIQPNMVIFMHMILLDSTRGITMSPGETVLVTETGCERLSRMPLDLVVK